MNEVIKDFPDELIDLYGAIAAHLARQRAQAVDSDGESCRYRAGDNACAVGGLLTLDQYNTAIKQFGENNIEGFVATNLPELLLEDMRRQYAPGYDLKGFTNALSAAQSYHDDTWSSSELTYSRRLEKSGKESNDTLQGFILKDLKEQWATFIE